MLRCKIIFFIFLMGSIVVAQEPPEFPEFEQPPPVPTVMIMTPEVNLISPSDVPHTELHQYLSTAVAHVNSMPEDITQNTDGTSLIPDESATQLMGFAKWLFSDTAAREVLGNTLAPIGINLFALLTLIVFMAITWATFRIFLLIYRFVQYIVREILRALPFVG